MTRNAAIEPEVNWFKWSSVCRILSNNHQCDHDQSSEHLRIQNLKLALELRKVRVGEIPDKNFFLATDNEDNSYLE